MSSRVSFNDRLQSFCHRVVMTLTPSISSSLDFGFWILDFGLAIDI